MTAHRAPTVYPELEIGFHRLAADYQVELRFSDPASEAEVPPEKGPAALDLAALLGLQQDARAYGEALAAQVFAEQRVRGLYDRVKTAVEASGRFLRLRLLVGPSAPELNGLHWELLRDPETLAPLATSEKTLFSRFLISRDWRPVKLRPKSDLRAIIAVAAPADLARYQLAAVDRDGEIARAQEALGAIRCTVLGREEPLTLERLAARLRAEGEKVDVLYLVCHGMLARGQAPYLFLQDEEGNVARVEGAALAERIGELPEPPRLAVLASCESGGTADGSTQAALAPHLAEAGVPAVVAMQGQVSMETVKTLVPVFFSELGKDGQIDRALSVARGTVRDRPDAWMPALYLRLKSGRIWYEPGFAGETGDFAKWKSICRRVRQGRFIPILGPDTGEVVTGSIEELAGRLADAEKVPLENHERTDLAKVAQYLSIDQDREYAQSKVVRQLRAQILERNSGLVDETPKDRPLPEILDALVAASFGPHGDVTSPYRVLAELPGRIYVNASAETLLFKSLQAAGKQPTLLACNWRPTGENHPSEPRFEGTPSAEKPVVYHVFGIFPQPNSLVLTEDDFFDYLIATSAYKLIPTAVRGSLTNSSLLFLGFPLAGWTFRVLFRLIMTLEGCSKLNQFSHVGVQVDPEAHSQADVERARKYLESYFGADRSAGRAEPQIDIYWGSAADFLKELHAQLAAMKDEEVSMMSSAAVSRGWY
jgi:CHAT domain/SIR2-like domain